jgi:hypothetical protein
MQDAVIPVNFVAIRLAGRDDADDFTALSITMADGQQRFHTPSREKTATKRHGINC